MYQIDGLCLFITSSSSTSASTPRNRNGRISWPEAPSIKQSFSLPDGIIYYMAKNPSSSKSYLKLAKSCKYFFQKLPLLIAKRIHDGGKILCSSGYRHECSTNNHKCCVYFDINKVTSRIWITEKFVFDRNGIQNLDLLLLKLYELSKTAKLYIDDGGIVPMNNFKQLATKFQKFYFEDVKIIDNDGNDAMLETILGAIPDVHEFRYLSFSRPSTFTALTFKNISKLKNLGKLKSFYLGNIPEAAGIQDITDFITKYKNTNISLNFHWGIFDTYKIQLDTLVDTVIKSELLGHVVIRYSGQNKEKLKTMENRH